MPDFQLTCGDALEWLKLQPDASIDLLITDPPYESLEKWRSLGTQTRLSHSGSSSNDWFSVIRNEQFPALLGECYRVLKKNTHIYCFSDATTMWVLKPALEAAKFKFWKPIVWDKKKIGMGYHYRNQHEFILFAEKGKRRLNSNSISDIIEAPRIWAGYPTEKPVSVSSVLISQSSQPGETVADPFCGSGSVGVAALKYGCHFLGNDLARTAVDLARSRLLEAGGNQI